jgi:hypothetical protein
MFIGYDAALTDEGSPGGQDNEGGAGEEDAAAGDDGGTSGNDGGEPDGAGAPDAEPGDSDGGEDASEGTDAADASAEQFECVPNGSYCDRNRYITCDENGEVESFERCEELGEQHEGECLVGKCVPGEGCTLVEAPNGMLCDDGLFCTVGEHCKYGDCVDGFENLCKIASGACRDGVCNEEEDRCETVPANPGGRCGENAYCNENGVCVGGAECLDAECVVSCGLGANPCRLSCGEASSCTATCGTGVSCDVDCAGTTDGCQVRCAMGSICGVDCAEAANCTKVKCEMGSQCILYCGEKRDTCGFAECQGGTARWCATDAAWVCNRDCP